jgi:integrase/recombinase XerD
MSEVTLYRNRDLPTLSTRIEDLIKLFLASNDVRESSKLQYARTIKPFFAWISKNQLSLPEIDRTDILNYKDDLLKAGISSATANSYLTAVRKFYEYVESVKLYPNVARGVKGTKCKKLFRKQALNEGQGKDLVKHLHENANLRDCAIVNLLLRTGLRTIEVIRANVGDIVFKAGRRVLLIHGKGRDEKDNFVVLTDKANESITQYLASRNNPGSQEPLFAADGNNNKGGRLTTRTISRIAKGNLKGIGLDSREFTAHSLRHTTAVNILRAGGTINQAQDVLRHSSPATTQIYTQTIKEELRLQNAPESLLDSAY